MPADIHVQRFPCPQCRSLRTIQTDTTENTETLSCPDCSHIWDRVVLPVRPPANRHQVTASGPTALDPDP